MRTSFHHQPEAQHPNFPLSTSRQADYPIFRGQSGLTADVFLMSADDPQRSFGFLSRMIGCKSTFLDCRINASSIELNSILGGELMDISDRNCWRLSRCDRVVRCGNRCKPHELLKCRGRKHEEIVILGIPRIAQLMRDPARSHESIARSEDELLISNNDFQFSGKDKVGLILTRVSMPRNANPRCEIHLQQAVCSSGIRAR